MDHRVIVERGNPLVTSVGPSAACGTYAAPPLLHLRTVQLQPGVSDGCGFKSHTPHGNLIQQGGEYHVDGRQHLTYISNDRPRSQFSLSGPYPNRPGAGHSCL